MKALVIYLGLMLPIGLTAESLEMRISRVTSQWKSEMQKLTEYQGLKSFCEQSAYRRQVIAMLHEIHAYHDELEKLLTSPHSAHTTRVARRLIRHLDHLEEHYNVHAFKLFFHDQCGLQQKIERRSAHYKAGFGVHSYSGKVYAQEVEMYRYIKKLTRKIVRIRKHVGHFYRRKPAWDHS
ncbi:hypothetical protein [Marinoscillum furvescens]|uniref:Uncharacterized protein n=1 Tax=Marinoscillum furvescens DSM 4134 TaxID=1122208 RepID=A0A3D9L3G4_MARFU|nr:hypothetical protein [Marinoscillum furvescens]RED97911.1 hypothetical protein C7460_11152 [Marinoscillum furvescens DSM 4134]